MALDIWIGDWNQPESQLVLSFGEDAAYYWFMYPLVEKLAKEKDKYIDLYDRTVFEPDELPQINSLIVEVRSMVDEQTSKWKIPGGTIYDRDGRIVDDGLIEVKKEDFLQFLDEWELAIAKCKQLQKPMVFQGD